MEMHSFREVGVAKKNIYNNFFWKKKKDCWDLVKGKLVFENSFGVNPFQ